MKILHTADWQIGKPFGSIADPDKRAAARKARIDAVDRVAEHARAHDVDVVLVAGDLFDSTGSERGAVLQTCAALGRIPCPVIVIPGNHDHGGPGSVWHQEYFRDALQQYAPRVIVALEPAPIVLPDIVVFPCPLLRRSEAFDVTAWLRNGEVLRAAPAGAVRIVLAHGTVLDFSGAASDAEAALDAEAASDTSGAVRAKAWYSGAHEPDRFPKGADYASGSVLLVDVQRGQAPAVQTLPSGMLRWHVVERALHGADAVADLRAHLFTYLGARVQEDLIDLRLTGSISLAARAALDAVLAEFDALLLRFDVDDRTVLEPTDAEIEALTQRAADPMLARIAARLHEEMRAGGADADDARLALRELHRAVQELS
ncbi:MAG: metallophosphoesterase [Chloroflexi bacterium]|nr:metallophosphoesterase [Chloroflexota bacterium]